jgi:hypothetical protein
MEHLKRYLLNVDSTTGQIPTCFYKSSSAHPEIKATNSIANVDSKFFVFIFFDFNRLSILHNKGCYVVK